MKRYTDEELMGALQKAWAERGAPWRAGEWQKLKKLPSFRSYYVRYGSWPAAVEAAGLDYPKRARRNYSTEGILRKLREAAGEAGAISSLRYERWREEHGGPSLSHIRKCFGNWTTAVERAGLTRVTGFREKQVIEHLVAYYREFGCWPTLPAFIKRYGSTGINFQRRNWRSFLKEARDTLQLTNAPLNGRKADWMLCRALDSDLTTRQRFIKKELLAGLTYTDIADKLGLSRERVRQLVGRAAYIISHGERPIEYHGK